MHINFISIQEMRVLLTEFSMPFRTRNLFRVVCSHCVMFVCGLSTGIAKMANRYVPAKITITHKSILNPSHHNKSFIYGIRGTMLKHINPNQFTWMPPSIKPKWYIAQRKFYSYTIISIVIATSKTFRA